MRCLVVIALTAGALPQCTLDGAGPTFRIAPTADDAIRAAEATGCPLIAFVNQPARVVVGAVSYRVDRSDIPGTRTWAGSASGGEYLPADATDMELLAAAAAHLPRRLPAGPVCPGGRCRPE